MDRIGDSPSVLCWRHVLRVELSDAGYCMSGLVISGGRVVDPASGMDAVCDVALVEGRIAAVGTSLGGADHVIDATGLVVAPGFIDLHAHGQSVPADRMQAFDGVTTTLDLEAGVMPVASWYTRQAVQGRVLNYGAATNWAFARINAMTGSNAESSLEAFGNAMRDRRWVENVASDAELAGILDRLARGLDEGGIGIGILNAYAPGAGVQELTAVCQLAYAHGVPTFTHVAYMSRLDPASAAEAYIRLIGYAGATGAHMPEMQEIAAFASEDAPTRDIYAGIAALYDELAQDAAGLKREICALDAFLGGDPTSALHAAK